MGEIDVHGGQLEFVSPILYSVKTLNISNNLKTMHCGLNRMLSSELMLTKVVLGQPIKDDII